MLPNPHLRVQTSTWTSCHEISEGLAEGIRLGVFTTDSAEGPADRRAGMNRVNDATDPRARRDRDMGLRAIERHKDVFSAEAGDRLDTSSAGTGSASRLDTSMPSVTELRERVRQTARASHGCPLPVLA
jgi:hypothetical protein